MTRLYPKMTTNPCLPLRISPIGLSVLCVVGGSVYKIRHLGQAKGIERVVNAFKFR